MQNNRRLIEIVRILGSSPRTSAEQLAYHFRVSPRTIYRDIAALHRMNVPVVGESGFGYHLDPEAGLDPVVFTADELQAIFESARKDLAVAEPGSADAILRALSKVQQVLPDVLLYALLQGPLSIGGGDDGAPEDGEPLAEAG